jgi:hypothetical protein
VSGRAALLGARAEQESTAGLAATWRRPAVLVVAAALVLVASGAAAFVLVGGGAPEPGAQGAPAAGVPSTAPTGAPEPGFDDLGRDITETTKVRNPFEAAGGTAPTASADTTGGATSTATVTRTSSPSAVYVALFRLGSSSKNPTADLYVNGVPYLNSQPGDVLGRGSTKVTYKGPTQDGECAVLGYSSSAVPVCDGEMLELG